MQLLKETSKLQHIVPAFTCQSHRLNHPRPRDSYPQNTHETHSQNQHKRIRIWKSNNDEHPTKNIYRRRNIPDLAEWGSIAAGAWRLWSPPSHLLFVTGPLPRNWSEIKDKYIVRFSCGSSSLGNAVPFAVPFEVKERVRVRVRRRREGRSCRWQGKRLLLVSSSSQFSSATTSHAQQRNNVSSRCRRRRMHISNKKPLFNLVKCIGKKYSNLILWGICNRRFEIGWNRGIRVGWRVLGMHWVIDVESDSVEVSNWIFLRIL